MAASCNYDLLHATVMTAVVNLALSSNSVPLAITRVIESEARDWTILPCVQVAPAAGGKDTRLWGTCWLMRYGVEVAVISAGNSDLVTGLSPQLGWRAQLKTQLMGVGNLQALGLTSVSDVEVNEDPPFDRGQIPSGFNASLIQFVFVCLEDK